MGWSVSVSFEDIQDAWRSATPIDAHQQVQHLANEALKRARREKMTDVATFFAAVAGIAAVLAKYPSALAIGGGALLIAVVSYSTWSRYRLSNMIIHWDPHLFHQSVTELVAAKAADLRFRTLVANGMPFLMMLVWLWTIYVRSGARISHMAETVITEGMPITLAFAAGAAFVIVWARRAKRAAQLELAQFRRIAAEYAAYAPASGWEALKPGQGENAPPIP